MKLTDRRLYQAKSLEDFAFRFYYNELDNLPRRLAAREANALPTGFIAPDTNRIWGPDVSHWDGNVDFRPTADYGGKFAIIKAMDGTIPTRYWQDNNSRAYNAGLLNGPYAWLYPDSRVSCTLQARAYHDLIRDAPLRLPPTIDFEWTTYGGVSANPNYTDLRKWAAEFIRVSGTKPILYSAAGYMNMFGRMPDDLRGMFSAFWLASYGGSFPVLPMGFTQTDWDLWQFTASGDALLLCPGDTGKRELDLNYMTQAFYDKYITSTPQEPGETMDYRIVWDNGANERTGPSTSDPWTGKIYAEGEIVQIVGDPIVKVTGYDVWGKLPNNCYIALIYNGQERAVPVLPEGEPEPIAYPVRVELVYGDGTRKVYLPE